MRREARAIGRRAVSVGAGARAGDGLRAQLKEGGIEAVLVAGICGALDPSLAPGDVILASSALADGKPELHSDARLLVAARAALAAQTRGRVPQRRDGAPDGFVCSRLLTIPAPTVDAGERRSLWRDVAAAAVDMETYALAEAATEGGIPWLAVRTVSDAAEARLPSAIASWRDERDDWPVAFAIARRPREWTLAVRLAWDTRMALQSLARATAVVSAAFDGMTTPADEG